MGDFARRGGRRTVAVAVLAALALGAVVLAVLRPTEQEAFRAWLRDQPGVVSVDEPRALSSGVVAARVVEPTERALLAGQPDVAAVARLGRAVAAYGAQHPAVDGTTVELRHGADIVLISTRPAVNATSVALLRAMESLPQLVSVAITASSGGVPFTATVRAGSDLAAAATALARVLPDGDSTWVTSAGVVAVRDDGAGHEIQVTRGATVSPADAAAFALGVKQDPTHRVTLLALGEPGTPAVVGRTIIRLSQSPRTAEVAAALHRSGYGLASRGQTVMGPGGDIAMDERAWSTTASAALSNQPGVLAAHVDAGSADENRPVVADLRVEPEVAFEQVLGSLPAPIERLEVHTSAAAPDYDRDDSLAPDPEVDCPTSGSGLNLAYSGPRDRLPKAANYLSALRAASSGATCVHWAEPGQQRRPTNQTLLVRLPLREASWRPVLDVVRARRADLGSAHPRVVLLLPLPDDRGTAVFNLAEGEAPYVTTLEGGTPAQNRSSETALAPLLRYWSAR